MTLLTDVSAKLHNLEVNFCDGVRYARSALEYSDHARIVAKIERGLPDHYLLFLTSGFL